MSEALGRGAALRTQLRDCTGARLHKLARLMGRYYDAELAKVGLRTSQFWLLAEVLLRDSVRPIDLAEAMGLDPSTVTRKIKPLIASGWVEQGPGTDGRTRAVCITASGRKKHAEGVRSWRAAEAGIAAMLGSKTIDKLDAVIGECLEIAAA
jgi:DNA-binding MarR family transcriptional regulator